MTRPPEPRSAKPPASPSGWAHYRSATASSQQALSLFHDVRSSQAAYALDELGLVQQLTGDYPAAAASHQQALELNRDSGNRLGQAETLNCLGELATRTADGRQARDHHAQALAIARDLGTLPDQARALEGIGHSHLRDGHPSEATASLEQALALYQHLAAPAARRVQETLHQVRQGNPAPARSGKPPDPNSYSKPPQPVT
jgi:tetratricopeptide (TPR) repeat protein